VLGPEVQKRFLGVPLVTRAEVIGLLAVRLPEGIGIDVVADSAAERLLSALADQAAVAIDHAREREMRDKLEERVGSLERQHTNQDQAIRFLSHDIRTALSSIEGYSSLLAGGILGEVNDRQKDALERIRQVGTHLLSLLANVMEVARMRTEGLTFRTSNVLLGSVATDAVNIVIPVASEADIRISVVDGSPVEVLTDRHRLRQVLVQLLDNAVKYSPDGSTITVKTGVVSGDDRTWGEVAISDQGRGIAAEKIETIFHPYERVLQAQGTERSAGGLGLGLSIARGLVQQMGGVITVDSEPGKGSTFAVRMPLVAGH
jgi:signal transduction histidine kinase